MTIPTMTDMNTVASSVSSADSVCIFPRNGVAWEAARRKLRGGSGASADSVQSVGKTDSPAKLLSHAVIWPNTLTFKLTTDESDADF